ncbi:MULTISPECIES: GNAT family N-acetyltransferase [Metabacillus]|uniref:N-acetyltransferase domain-containing protein n=1 Tax=Metabacillus indicus TaxID=246786 RepID=A0A084H2U7_METID|nr:MULTISPECIES: GNAT family N-acetyltransferase [Metabacillus]KEZ52697.1 hypothetical protein AZ46_0202815 [Metabacillus indicus LMG 22858]KEZ53909.1 hypothetical protein GS18_0202925 [Metabacillus indicus]
MDFRLLTLEDTEQYRSLRLQALEELPFHFASAYEIEKKKSIEELMDEIRPSGSQFIAGAFSGRELTGITAFKQEPLHKMKHRGQILSMYISPSARGNGAGKSLLTYLLDRIKENPAIEKADLAVGAENKGAIALYRSLGFVQYGEYANALKVDGEYVDELYMTLALKTEKIR